MSSRSWRAALKQTLTRRSAADRPPRIAVVGIGQELHGDDAVGLLLVRALRRRLGDRDRVLLIEAGPSPENVTGRLRRFGPSIVVLVDAALMGEPPGTIRCLDPIGTDGLSASSHTLPPRLVAGFLARELGCDLCLLGIEPVRTDFLASPSPAVRLGVNRAVRCLAGLLTGDLA